MSLWTPSGEHQVGREAAGPPSAGPAAPSAPGAPGGAGAPPAAGRPRTGEPPEDAADMEQLRRQLADAPAEVVIANHCYGLFELAAVYLSQAPPLLSQAQLAIDALGYLVDGLGDRLGEPRASLQEALAQVRLAYVQLGATEQGRQDAGNGHDG